MFEQHSITAEVITIPVTLPDKSEAVITLWWQPESKEILKVEYKQEAING